MRTVEIDGQAFEVRGLKRKEVKQLKREGIILVNLDPEMGEDAMDKVFDMVFTTDQIEEIDELQNADALQIWSAILLETYGAPGEEKN